MKTIIATLTACSALALGAATTAQAGGPTCSAFGAGWANHGAHVTGDYVNPPGRDGTAPADGARGGPAHLTSAPAPGASFCLDQANSPGWHPSDFPS